MPQLVTAFPGDGKVFGLRFVERAGQAIHHNRDELPRGGQRGFQFMGQGVVKVLDFLVSPREVAVGLLQLGLDAADLFFGLLAGGDFHHDALELAAPFLCWVRRASWC